METLTFSESLENYSGNLTWEKTIELKELFTNNLRLVEISRGEDEEDFTILTTLTIDEINSAITPLIWKQRDGGEMEWSNEDLVNTLEEIYPEYIIIKQEELYRLEI